MSDPVNPRRPARYPVPITGSIGAVEAPRTFGMGMYRPVILKAAKDYLSSIMGAASEAVRPAPEQGYGLGLGEAVRWGANKGREFVADSLENASTGYDDSANNLPLVRMPNGIMSLQVDPRLLDVFDATTLGAMGITHLGKGLVRGTQQAIREFLEAGVRAGGQILQGPRSATWNAAKAKAFEEAEKAGGKADDLWRSTGTGRLKDGSLFQELDDSQAKLLTDFTGAGKPLREVVDYPEFAQAYPDLMDTVKVKLEVDPGMRKEPWGEYNSGTKVLSVYARNMDEARSLVLHEMQHSVSRAEGRATGSSPDKAGSLINAALADPNTSPELRSRLKQLAYDDYAAYSSFQDEVAAFTVQNRRDMTAAQRAEEPPAWTRDPKDWIINRDDAPGISMGADGNAAPKASSTPLARINVGLRRGRDGELYAPEEAIAALRDLGIDTRQYGVVQEAGDTEPTLIAELSRAATPDEMARLSEKLGQEAIPQKVGDVGELYGPKAAEWGGYIDEYFKDLGKIRSTSVVDSSAPAGAPGKRRLKSGARKEAEQAAKKEGRNVTTADLLRNADDEVAARVAEARVALEHPGRSIHADNEADSLFDRSTIKDALQGHPGVKQEALAREVAASQKKRDEIDAMVDEIFGGENRWLIARQVRRGLDIGGDTYYPSTYPLRIRSEQIGANFDQFAASQAATSFRNKLPNNFASGTLLRYLHKRGYDITDYRSLQAAAQAIAKKRGHQGFSLLQNHVGFYDDIVSGRTVGFDNAQKGAAYFQNLRGNFEPMTLDTHEAKGLTIGSRFFPVYARKGGFSTNEYGAFEGRYRDLISEVFPGIRPASGQGGRWYGGGDLTGLATDPGDFLSTMEHMIQYTAEQLGMPTDRASLQQLADMILAGDEIMVPYYPGTGKPNMPTLKSKKQKGFINPEVAALLGGGAAAGAASLPLLADDE